MERHKYSYLTEKFAQAVGLLATDPRGIKERLKSACVRLSGFNADNFPDHLKEYWNDINALILSQKPVTNSKGEVIVGILDNSIEHLSESDCISLANQIYDLKIMLEDL